MRLRGLSSARLQASHAAGPDRGWRSRESFESWVYTKGEEECEQHLSQRRCRRKIAGDVSPPWPPRFRRAHHNPAIGAGGRGRGRGLGRGRSDPRPRPRPRGRLRLRPPLAVPIGCEHPSWKGVSFCRLPREHCACRGIRSTGGALISRVRRVRTKEHRNAFEGAPSMTPERVKAILDEIPRAAFLTSM